MNAHWTSAPLRTVLERVERPESVDPSRTYRLLGVKLYCQGARLQDTVAGDSLKTPKLFRVEEGDITYNKMWVTKGAYAVLRAEHHGAHATSEYPTFRPRASGLDRDFFEYVMQTEAFQAVAASRCSGSTSRARLHPEEFLDVEIPLPPLAEQKKIAAILSSVDEAIRANEAVIEQTRRVKEGLLQELLTRGIGHTEFRETEIGPLPVGWTAPLLDEVAARGSGHTPSKSHPEYWNGGIQWVSLADSSELDRVHLSTTAKTISHLGIENSSAVIHPAGTVFVSRDASVGRSAISTCELAVSQHFIAWVCGPSLDKYYLYYFLQRNKPDFERVAMGSTIKTIGLGYFKRLRVPLPPLYEQQRIANTLLSHDESIFAAASAIAGLQRLKSGLLQDLLTGKVRVSP